MKKLLRRGLAAVLACGLLSGTAGAVNWGLSYRKGLGQPPSGEDSVQTLAKYGAYYMGNTDEKTLYLTFDCGYENGNTAAILDTLKKQHVPAAFFVVGHYLDTAPELVQRMGDEGHLVCNHSLRHPNMTRVGQTRFQNELNGLAEQYKKLTGRSIAPFYRPPEGAYTYDNLRWAQALGYHTTLWSVAHADWDEKKQPSRESALNIVRKRAHNGAIVLLHAVSSTNAAILDELITGWKEQGYTFRALSALPGLPAPTVNAIPSASRFCAAGKPYNLTAYLIENSNYIKLRDVAAALAYTDKEFSVYYDASEQTVVLTSGSAYQLLGGELTGRQDVAVMQALSGAQTVSLDGNALALTAYNIEGTNYVKLRDIAQAIDCGVTYDPSTGAVGLEPDMQYTE